MSVFETKVEMVRGLLVELELDAAVFTTQANFAWLTGGRDNHVGLATEAGNAAAVVTRGETFFIADNIEAGRIEDEEASGFNIEVMDYPWWDPKLPERLTALIGSDNWLSDSGLGGKGSIEAQMYPLRASLLDEEVVTYRELGKWTGLALQAAADRVEIGMKEHQAAGLIVEPLVSRGIYPSVVLIASDERLSNYRHPIPTNKRIEKAVMLVVGARWKGLVCSATRIVHFGKVPTELEAKHKAVCTVDTAFLAHTVPGETIGDAFNAGLKAYADTGYGEEWMLHHQGGATGYKPREFRAFKDSPQVIQNNQAFAWNPSITGTKSEDTVIAAEPFPEVLTATPDWPQIEIESAAGAVKRYGILVK